MYSMSNRRGQAVGIASLWEIMRLIRITGYRLKGGKLVRNAYKLDVSTRIKQRSSKRVRVARPLEVEVEKVAYRCPDTADMFCK